MKTYFLLRTKNNSLKIIRDLCASLLRILFYSKQEPNQSLTVPTNKLQSVNLSEVQFNTVSIPSNLILKAMEEIIKGDLVTRLQAVKQKSGKSYNQLAEETGLTNVYVAQLLRRQAQLKPETAPKLRAALPDLPEQLLLEMIKPPLRSYDPNLIQDPTIYRSYVSSLSSLSICHIYSFNF